MSTSAPVVGLQPADTLSFDRSVRVIRPPGLSLPFILQGIKDVFDYRDLLYTLTLHRVKVRYKQSVLGIAWAVVQPLALMLVYTVIFSVVARVKSDGTPYALLTFAGLLPWTFFSTSLTNSATALVSHTALVTKVFFPREILPLTYVIAALCDLAIACLILAAMMAFYHVVPTAAVFWVIPIMIVGSLLATSLAFLLSATQVKYRDIGIALPLALQIGMFATPVVYPLKEVPARMRFWFELNPMTGVVENFRRAVLGTAPVDLNLLGISAAISIVLFIGCYLYFKKVESSMADLI